MMKNNNTINLYNTGTTAIPSPVFHDDRKKYEQVKKYVKIDINERECVKILKDKLSSKFDRIEIHKRPYNSSKIRNYLKKELKIVPLLQPEIDMIIFDGNNLNAIEIKLLRKKGNKLNLSYYNGIDQALALCFFGFDHVALWLIIVEEIESERIHKYGAMAWSFIRNVSRLPIDYTYFTLRKNDRGFDFIENQYETQTQGIQLQRIENSPFHWHKNPMKNKPVPKKIRKALDLWFANKL